MIVLVAGSGLGLLSLPYAMARLGRQLPPRRWAPLCMVALAGGAALSIGSALLIAAPAALALIGLPSAAQACRAMLGALYPGGPFAPIAAGSLVVWAIAATSHVVVQARRTARRASAGAHYGDHVGQREGFDVVVIPDQRRYALSVPRRHRQGQMLVSRGVVDALSSDQLDLVCAHEAAHLRLGHGRQLILALIVERVFWFWAPARRGVDALRIAIEESADEAAAGPSPERRHRLRNAILVVAGVSGIPTLASFNASHAVEQRLTSLAFHPRRGNLSAWTLILLPGLLLGLVAVFSTTVFGHQAYCFVAMPGHCP